MVYNFHIMVACIQCGNDNRSEARFCRICGQPLTPAPSLEALPGEVESQEIDPELEPILLPDEYPPGVVLHSRYRLRRRLEAAESGPRYEADDLLLCRTCQALQTTTEATFCEVCGADLTVKPLVILVANQQPDNEQPGLDRAAFIEGDFSYLVEHLQEVPLPANLQPGYRLVSGFQSHPGQVRENNEDSLVAIQLAGMCDQTCSLMIGFFAVADGVGGAASGEVASQLAVRNLVAGVSERIFHPEMTGAPLPTEHLPQVLSELVLAANQAILDLRNQKRDSDMGCTLTAALVRGTQVVLANVGDSRVYRLHEGKLNLVTQDHSMVARLVEEGLIQPEEVYTHAQRSIIYRSLGSRADLDVDVFCLELAAGDRLLLCSDGLWEMVRDPMIEEILLQGNDPQQACDRLVELANLAGGEDNVSVIVLILQEA